MDTRLPALRVLLIEDNPGDARLVQTALDEQAPGGFAITWVERLAGALACLAAEPFDVVLSDLGLPDSNRLDTVQAIVGHATGLPLVVLTGSHDAHVGRESIKLGAQDYLIKGESGGALIDRSLRYAIERKRMDIALRAANETLEQRIAERTGELQKELAERERAQATLRQQNAELGILDAGGIDRELVMIGLKQQVNALSRQLGQKAPYDVDFADPTPQVQP